MLKSYWMLRLTPVATLTKPQKWINFQKAPLKNLFSSLNVIYHAMPLAFIFVNG